MVYEFEIEIVYYHFSKNKEIFNFSNYSAKLKYYDDSNALVDGKMEHEMGGTVIERFVGLKAKT